MVVFGHLCFLKTGILECTSSSSSVGTATLVGFGLLNYR